SFSPLYASGLTAARTRRLNQYNAALRAGDRPPHSDQVAFRIYNDNFEILGRDTIIAHPTAHPQPLHNATRCRPRAHRTRRALTVRLAVCLGLAVKTMPLHCPGETAPFARADHVHALTGDK